jgi:hypothetical protein
MKIKQKENKNKNKKGLKKEKLDNQEVNLCGNEIILHYTL